MPRLSQLKRDKIAEQLLHHLFTIAPASCFTNAIAKEIARDEEFTRSLLLELQQKKLVVEIAKNPAGKQYARRKRWRLSNEAYRAYKEHQPSLSSVSTQSSSSPLSQTPQTADTPIILKPKPETSPEAEPNIPNYIS